MAEQLRVGVASNDWSQTYAGEGVRPPLGGSGWIRVGQYEQFLKEQGVEFFVGKLALMHGKRDFAVQLWEDNNFYGELDILVVQRYMNKQLAKDLRQLKNVRRATIVQDIDDWYWGLDKRNHAAKAADPRINPDNNIQHYKQIIGLSDFVIVSTPYLKERVSSFFRADKIFIQENHVNFSEFHRRQHKEAKKPVIGWFGSTAHRSGDLQILRGVLSTVQEDFGFVHVGDMTSKDGLWLDGTKRSYPPFHKEVGIDEESMTNRLPLMPHDQLVQYGFQYDIGIVPLNLIPFNRAKSWIKGLEYVAAGIPFIASPSDEYVRFQEEYGVGRLARTGEDWLRHLEALRDPEVRQKEADENFEKVQSLDTSAGAKKLTELYRHINEISK